MAEETEAKIRDLNRVRRALSGAGFPIDMKPSPGYETAIISEGARRTSEDELKDRIVSSVNNGTVTGEEKVLKQVTIESFGLESKPAEVWLNLRELLEKSKGGELMEKYGFMKTARPRVATLLEGVVKEGHKEQNVSREEIRDEANRMIDHALAGLASF
jgi:hypothetical protein